MSPESTVLIPRVVMKESTRNLETIIPFTKPITALITMGRRKQSGRGTPATANSADITPPRLAILPMERSNSLMLMMRVAPIEMITKSEICLLILMKFVSVKKEVGLRMLNTAMMRKSASNVPYVWSKDLRFFFMPIPFFRRYNNRITPVWRSVFDRW